MVTFKSNVSNVSSLEDWMLNPPDATEWVDGKLVEKYPLEMGGWEIS